MQTTRRWHDRRNPRDVSFACLPYIFYICIPWCNGSISEPAYKNYGKRGISVCDEWLDEENGLNNFCKWALSNGYNPNAKFQECTLDRIDVNGDYEPDNCRFVSNYVQARNKTNNIYITYNGETKLLADWAKHFNFPPNLFRFRYLKGWDIDRIVNTPRKRRNMK